MYCLPFIHHLNYCIFRSFTSSDFYSLFLLQFFSFNFVLCQLFSSLFFVSFCAHLDNSVKSTCHNRIPSAFPFEFVIFFLVQTNFKCTTSTKPWKTNRMRWFKNKVVRENCECAKTQSECLHDSALSKYTQKLREVSQGCAVCQFTF